MPALQIAFPGSRHVLAIGLHQADDSAIWEHALAHGFTVVTRDSDYFDMSVKRGHPPKIVWLRTGNTATRQVRRLLTDRQRDIERFLADPSTACLQIFL